MSTARPNSATVAAMLETYLYRSGSLAWGPFWALLEHNFSIGYDGDLTSKRKFAVGHADVDAINILDSLLLMKRTAREKCGDKVNAAIEKRCAADVKLEAKLFDAASLGPTKPLTPPTLRISALPERMKPLKPECPTCGHRWCPYNKSSSLP